MFKRLSVMCVAAAGLCLVSANARADTMYSIGLPNTAVSPYPGPYATVNVALDSSTQATITFTGLNNGTYQYLLGANSAADVNVNASSWTIGGFTQTVLPGFSTGALSDGGANNVSTFGSFNQTVDKFDGFTNSASVIGFVLTNTGGTWASDASVLTANASGYLAAAHIFVCQLVQGVCSTTSGALATGYAANGTSPVPLPGALPLFGTGLAGLGLLALRRKRKVRAITT